MLEHFKELFYVSETSASGLRWRDNRWAGFSNNTLNAAKDSVAGSINTQGYWMVYCNFLKTSVSCHRIVYMLSSNVELEKEDQVDHVDGVRSNNLIHNLRQVTFAGNARNQKLRADSSTGVQGVTWNVRTADGYVSAMAQWTDLNGKKRQKYFAVTKYGEAGAFDLACRFREQAIRELNLLNAGYSDRHGK